MPRNSRIHKVNVMSHVRNDKENDKETDQPLYGEARYGEADRQNRLGEFALLSDAVVEAMVASCEAWLRIVQEYNSEILKTYRNVFWGIPAICVFPLELTQRSIAVYLVSIGQQSKTANLPALRVERRYFETRGTVDSIESAMDVAIGADREPLTRTRTATAA